MRVAPAVAPQKLKQRLKTKTKLAAPRVKKQKLKTKPPRLRRPKPKTVVTVPQKQVSKTVSTVAPQVSKTVSKTSQKQVVEAIQGWFYCGSCYRKGPHGVDRCVHCGVKFVFCRHGDGGKYRPKQCIAYYGSVGSS